MKKATLPAVRFVVDLLETIEDSEIEPSVLKKLIELTGQKKLTREQIIALAQSPCYSDLLESAKIGTLGAVYRTVYRQALGLARNVSEVKTNQRLRHRGSVSVLPRTIRFNPSDFFRNSRVGDRFRRYILSAAGQTDSLPETALAVYDLAKTANDAEIRAELPGDHVFSATEACAYIAHLLERQKNGENGDLITNGYANIFYVRDASAGVFAVSVRWSAGGREWDVDAGRLGAGRWRAVGSVFSRNC